MCLKYLKSFFSKPSIWVSSGIVSIGCFFSSVNGLYFLVSYLISYYFMPCSFLLRLPIFNITMWQLWKLDPQDFLFLLLIIVLQ